MAMETQVALAKDALEKLGVQIASLGPELKKAAGLVAEPTSALGRVIKDGLVSQGRQQFFVLLLTAVIATATVAVVWVTWISAVAVEKQTIAVQEQTEIQRQALMVQKEQNQIQREVLDFQKANLLTVAGAKK